MSARRRIGKPRNWDAWGTKERAIFAEMIRYRHESADLEDTLRKALPPEHFKLVDALASAERAATSCEADLFAARLQRYRPDLADLIAWAGPDGIEWWDESADEALQLPILEAN